MHDLLIIEIYSFFLFGVWVGYENIFFHSYGVTGGVYSEMHVSHVYISIPYNILMI